MIELRDINVGNDFDVKENPSQPNLLSSFNLYQRTHLRVKKIEGRLI